MPWITPYHSIDDFSHPLTIDDKITIFEEQTLGWVLGIAHVMLNGNLAEMRHAGWAAMIVAFTYFEMIAKTKVGFDCMGKSEKYFWNGVCDVFPALIKFTTTEQEDLKGILYGSIRCGFYHAGMSHGRVIISGDLPDALAYDTARRAVSVNPHLLIPIQQEHFSKYIADLKSPENSELRERFERRFDFINQWDPLKA